MDWTAPAIIAAMAITVMTLWAAVVIVEQRRAKTGVEVEE